MGQRKFSAKAESLVVPCLAKGDLKLILLQILKLILQWILKLVLLQILKLTLLHTLKDVNLFRISVRKRPHAKGKDKGQIQVKWPFALRYIMFQASDHLKNIHMSYFGSFSIFMPLLNWIYFLDLFHNHHLQVVYFDEISDKHVDGNDRGLIWNKQKAPYNNTTTTTIMFMIMIIIMFIVMNINIKKLGLD